MKENKKGFTLVELIVVIVIIGILAGVLIPSITSYVRKAKLNANYQEAIIVCEYMDRAMLEGWSYEHLVIGECVVEEFEDFEACDMGELYKYYSGKTLPSDVTIRVEEDEDTDDLYNLVYYHRGLEITVNLDTRTYTDTTK